jgi:hypothetical protein
MSKPKFSKSDVAREYVRRFPKSSKRAIARMLVRDYPSVWLTLNAADLTVRYVTGSLGQRSAQAASHKELFHKGHKGLPELPEGITSFVDWKPVVVPGETKTLILPDVHIPYHDKAALLTAIEYGVARNPTHILLNGDWMDFFSVSFWEKDPRKRDLKREIDMGRDMLSYLRCRFPDAQIIFKIGNHEERWERYLSVKAPELLGVEDFEIRNVLRLEKMGVDLVSDMRPLKFGELFVVHGHEFKWGITNPVNPARGFFMRAQDHCLGSHLHRTSSHSEKKMDGEVISTWSTGCLCDLHPDYQPINKWNHGFAYLEVDKRGMFQLDNRKVIDGEVYRD